MFNSKKWRFGTSLLLTLGMTLATATPGLMSNPAMAQFYRQRQYGNQRGQYPNNLQRQFPGNPRTLPVNQRRPLPVAQIPAGTLIPVGYEEAEKVVLTPDESMRLRLTVTQDIRDVQGRVVIPFGSEIEGQLRPVSNGTQFFAEQVIIGDRRRFRIDAISKVVTDTERITKGANAGDILKGAAVGTGAAALLSAVLGDDVLEVERLLIGAGLGALGGVFVGRDKVEVVVIYPEEDLDLRLRSDFAWR
ncbi:hypothetical protein AFK68_26460 [Hydrocoleum sp. CS-953]|uniref:hypothetical protein n=1 Tax=Hydrocoleum sp. CS-953 TaxID=1671698 RepID=UPI000B9AE5F8|nr:hypothetical protein [Hydrocoleum sp. CS-953]OZH52121.1 hypothetical protein AFK68_26460 [Hydrocoleum sp. CS-953]